MAIMQQPNPDMLLARHGNSGSSLVLWQESGSKYEASSLNFLTQNRRAHIMVRSSRSIDKAVRIHAVKP